MRDHVARIQHIHVSIICVDCGSPSLARPRRHSATRLRFRLIPARLLYRRPHWPSSVSIGTAATSSTCCRTSRTGHSSTWSRDTGVARATLLADRANNWLQTVFVSLQADREPIGRQSTCLTCWHQLPTSRRGRCARALTATTSSVELLSGSATGRSQSLPPAPRAWNRPPSELKTTTCSVETFKRRLKTVFLFNTAFSVSTSWHCNAPSFCLLGACTTSPCCNIVIVIARCSGRLNNMHGALRALHVSLNHAYMRTVRKFLKRNNRHLATLQIWMEWKYHVWKRRTELFWNLHPKTRKVYELKLALEKIYRTIFRRSS